MPWLALTLEVERAASEALSDALLEAGAASVALDGPDEQPPSLNALFESTADVPAALAQAALAAGLAQLPRYSVAEVQDEDWVRRSQAQFRPVRIGERLWVGPTWHEPPADAGAIVRIDPGLAFGTGSHPTTKLMLDFLARNVRGGERVLDYGCGSGILAIAAAKLGASCAVGVDVDPEALRTAAANARENGVALRLALPEEPESESYDLVLSNILAQPLILLAPLLASRTRPGGRIALAGILTAQAGEVAEAYAPFFACKPTAEEAGWSLLEGQRR